MRNILLTAAGALILWGCAQQVPISGGPEDETPPKILYSAPENFSVNFNRKTIEFRFDEFVEVKSLQQNALISPPLKYPVEHRIRGKKITLQIQDTLLENTTYIFNLGNAIVDFNEGNPLDSSLFVFSTGPELDSLEIRGKLINAEDLSPVKEGLVMLYLTDEDSLPYNEKPYFVTKADEAGKFEFKYLPEGKFKMFALVDDDMTFLYDEYREMIGFSDTLIPSGIEGELEIKMFKEHNPVLKIRDRDEVHYGQAFISFTNPVDSFALNPIKDTEDVPFIFEWSSERDSVVLWLENHEIYDTLEYELYADTLFDTISFTFKAPEKFIDKKSGESSVTFNLRADVTGSLSYFDTLTFSADHPIKEINTSGWLFIDRGDTLELDSLLKAGAANIVKDTGDAPKRFSVLYNWRQNTPYGIVIPDSQIFDLFGLSHDTLITTFSTTGEDDYGEFVINLDFPPASGQYILYLMDTENNVLKQRLVKHDETLVFPRERPRKFKLKVIDDLDKNGKWTPGNYMQKRQPEPVLFHPETPEMRSNWDLEIDWILEDQSLISN